MRSRVMKMILFAPFAIVGIALFVFLGGTIVQYLWNWLLPTLFGWSQITFWQALGLLVLSRILFGGWGSSGSGRGWRRRREWWDRMSPEERERFRQRMRERCGVGPAAGESEGRTAG